MKLLQKILQDLPFFLGVIPYRLSYLAALCIFKDKNTKVWARNSYALKRLSPGLSDIDFTFLFKTEISNLKILKKFQRFRFLKTIFPLWGEVNSYRENELKALPFIFNPLEKERDQKLKCFLNSPNMIGTTEEKLVYILRMLKADAHNLRTIPEKRTKKWLYHFEQLGISYNPNIQELMTKELLRPLQLNINENIFETFLNINEFSDEEVNSFYLPLTKEERRSFILLFPLRWLVVALRNHQFEQDLTIIKAFSENENKLLWEHLRWELMGIFSQYHQLSSECDLILHLDNIKKILLSPTTEKIAPLSNSLETLKIFIENYKQK